MKPDFTTETLSEMTKFHQEKILFSNLNDLIFKAIGIFPYGTLFLFDTKLFYLKKDI